MADLDAELAFVNSQKEYDPATAYAAPAPAEDDEEDEYDPAALTSSFAEHPHTPSDQSASMPESTAPTPAQDTHNSLKAPPAVANAPTPSKQPRTMGGFVVDSEDEDDVPETSKPAVGPAQLSASANTTGGMANSPQRSHTQTPNNALPQTNVPLHSAQDQGLSGVSSSDPATVNDAAPLVASVVSASATPVSETTKAVQPSTVPSVRPSTAPGTPAASAAMPKPRLPQDRVGILEDRIAEDPRGDMEAWLSLITEHRKRNKIDDARAVYDRFFKVFPSAAQEWAEYVSMESDLEEFTRIEQIFERSIMASPSVELWQTYINYIRRRNNLTTDQTGQARGIITQVYEFVLDNVGVDIESGKIWQEYIEFLKTGPGVLGGNTWQDMQKMDTMRKVYQRATAIPTKATVDIWRDYDRFEASVNKATGRKNLQERSNFYMTARSANHRLEGLLGGLDRTTLPRLPPAPGFDGYEQYMAQVAIWKNWIEFEKSDPLGISEADRPLFNKRVIFIYKQALMALRFWPEMWYDAAEWCFQNELAKDGNDFLDKGIDANPESCLLAFKKAYQLELSEEYEGGDGGILRKGEAVRAPIDKVLTSLYDLIAQTKKREELSLGRVKEVFAKQEEEEQERANSDNGSDDGYAGFEDAKAEAAEKRAKEKAEALKTQLQAISTGYNQQIHELKRAISFAWIALMRTMRRIQGKGRPDPPAGTAPGFRGIFSEARKKGRLLSDAYVASALIEHHCYQDPAASKIFERGMKLFPDDEAFALEYIKYLVKQNDATNARAVFETVVNRLTQKPESVTRAKPLFEYFHEYEAQFGDLVQITKLEKRMGDLFPEDPQLRRFAQRFSTSAFDPTQFRPVISQKAQMKPRMLNVMPTVEDRLVPPQPQTEHRASPVLNSPRLAPAALPVAPSPKRPFEESDNEAAQPRKLARGESPLKGAAGRRLDAARRPDMAAAQPDRLPQQINILLSMIPGAHTYKETRFRPDAMVSLLRATQLPISVPPGPAGEYVRNLSTPQQAPPHAPPPMQVQSPVVPSPLNAGWGGQMPPMGNMPGYPQNWHR